MQVRICEARVQMGLWVLNGTPVPVVLPCPSLG